MAVVAGVMAASILFGSMLNVFGSMSTNTGLMLFHHNEWVVATKLYGVVITSPEMRKASNATIKANVPFENKFKYLTPK